MSHVGANQLRALGDVVTGAEHRQYGVGGLIQGAAVIFFAYIGFEAVSTAGAESKNPAATCRSASSARCIICTVLYIATCAVLVGIVPYTELNNPAPIAPRSTPSACRGLPSW
jgi:APA family basic amino acid/polyamine antiporter